MNSKRAAANKTNALRSTGPRTKAGKSASSQNASRHGLGSNNVASRIAPQVQALANTIAEAVGSEVAPAHLVADAMLRQEQIQAVRDQMLCRALITVRTAMGDGMAAETLEDVALLAVMPELIRLEDYERRCSAKLRKSLKAL